MSVQNVLKYKCTEKGCPIETENKSNTIDDVFSGGYDSLDSIKHIHHSIPQQMATFINLDYSRLVEFLKAYWKWSEESGKPYFNLKHHLEMLSMEHQVYEYAKHLKNEYLYGFPDIASVYKVLDILIRNSRDIHTSAGTSEYVKFMHNLIVADRSDSYVSEIKTVYPSDYLLRTSNGKFRHSKGIMYITNLNETDLINKKIEQDTSSAVIENYTEFKNGVYSGYRLELGNINGSFDYNKELSIGEYIYPLSVITIENSGNGFNPGDKFLPVSKSSFKVSRTCKETGILEIGFRGEFAPTVVLENTEKNLSFEFKDGIAKSDEFTVGNTYIIEVPTVANDYHVFVSNDFGNIESIEYVNPSFGIELFTTDNQTVKFSTTVSSVEKTDDYYYNTDGFLSDKDVLQDSEYYQDYSYEIVITTDENNSIDSDSIDIVNPVGLSSYVNIRCVSVGCTFNNAVPEETEIRIESE